jgi:thermitase
MPVKITNSGSATYGDMASGIVWAADHGARVINVSYAGTSSSSTLDSAVAYAMNHGAIVVASAGNSGCNCPTYPASSPGAIAVAASDQRDGLETYSNWGPWVQVAAPAGDITTTLIFNGVPYTYAPAGGTSISAPVVAGILRLMLSYDPTATPTQLKNALFSMLIPSPA